MLVLLSPSKKIENTAPKDVQTTQPQLADEATGLSKILQNYSQKDIQNLMGLSDNLAALNHGRYQHFSEQEQSPALFTFKGDVYDKMDVANYSADDLAFAQNHIRILSGLYGVLRPLDAMRPYRLEMGTKLQTEAGKNLYAYWGTRVTQTLNEASADVVVNLASQEYFKAVQPENLSGDVLHVDFKQIKNGKTKTIGLMAKRARGLMADYMIKNRLQNPNELENFDREGYVFRPDMSDDAVLTFTLNMDDK